MSTVPERKKRTVKTKEKVSTTPVQEDKPRVLTLSSEDVKGTEALVQHFTKPQPLPKMPWEMEYEERRLNSKDPRIQKQVLDSKQWNNTCMEGVWERILCFTSPVLDWNMTQDDFRNWLSFEGIKSVFLKEKLLLIFDPPQQDVGTKGAIPSMKKCYNALKVCKVLETALTTYPYQDLFVQHCYERFDRPLGTDRLSASLIMNTQLKEVSSQGPLPGTGMGRAAIVGVFDDDTNPFKVKNGKKKGGGKKKRKSDVGLKQSMAAGAGYKMVEALKGIIEKGDFDIMRDDRSRVEAAKRLSLNKLHSTDTPSTQKKNDVPPRHQSPQFTLGRQSSSTPVAMAADTNSNTTLPNIADTAPRFDSPRPGSPHSTKPIRQIIPSLLTSHKEYNNDAPISPDEITYDMFKAAFLNPSNAKSFTSHFVLPILEAASKYFAAPHGELPLVSMRWERAMVPVPTMSFTEIIEATVGRAAASPTNKNRGQRRKSTASSINITSTTTDDNSSVVVPVPPSSAMTPHPPSTPSTTTAVDAQQQQLAIDQSAMVVPEKPRYCPYDADSVLLKECEHLGGIDPWRIPPKKKKKTSSAKKK